MRGRFADLAGDVAEDEAAAGASSSSGVTALALPTGNVTPLDAFLQSPETKPGAGWHKS